MVRVLQRNEREVLGFQVAKGSLEMQRTLCKGITLDKECTPIIKELSLFFLPDGMPCEDG